MIIAHGPTLWGLAWRRAYDYRWSLLRSPVKPAPRTGHNPRTQPASAIYWRIVDRVNRGLTP